MIPPINGLHSRLNALHRAAGFFEDGAPERHKAQGRCSLLGGVFQHVVENVLHSFSFGAIALGVDTQVSVAMVRTSGLGLGLLPARCSSSSMPLRALAPASTEAGTGLVLHRQPAFHDVRLIHVADRADPVVDAPATQVPLAPTPTGHFTDLPPGSNPAKGSASIGEGLGGSGSIRAMHPGDRARVTTKLFPITDAAGSHPTACWVS